MELVLCYQGIQRAHLGWGHQAGTAGAFPSTGPDLSGHLFSSLLRQDLSLA